MWWNIASIVVSCVAIGFATVALVKVRRSRKKALAFLDEAIRISDETIARSKRVEKQIENITRELNEALPGSG
jgi:hypothetical protein